MKKIIITFLFLLFCITSFSQERRLALVIGNGNYASGILSNPENDANAMEKSLTSIGFKVIKYENLTQNKLAKAIDDFGDKLKNYDVGLFFYAGHGIQSKGYNYLIPVDAVLKTESDVEYHCVRADRIFGKMTEAQNDINIIILDACRDNPFERSWSRAAASRGLTFMDAPRGSIIAYATAPGKTASDGYGEHSPYTEALIECMEIPNIKIEDYFKKVRSQVREQTKNYQIPWESTSLEGDFYFKHDENYAVDESINSNKNKVAANSATDTKRNASKIKSMAILPFANYSGDESQAYLGMGMQDALISEIGKLGTVRVISKTSTLSYADTEKSIQEIAYELNVDAVMEASIITIQDNIRLHLKLYDAYPEEKQIWSQTFDSDLTNIFNLYSEVTKKVAEEIQITLSPERQSKLSTERTVNPEAYKAYLSGKFHLFNLDKENIETAKDYFQNSIGIDSLYAPAYAGMVGVWAVLKQMDYVSADEADPNMEKYMKKALELDKENPDVYFYNAVKKTWTDFDWEGAERSYKKCLELNPNYSAAWAYYSHYLMCMKRNDEMRKTMKRALEIDPYNPLIQMLASAENMVLGEYTIAIENMQKLQMMLPPNPLIITVLAQCYAETEQYDLAIEQFKALFIGIGAQPLAEVLDSVYTNQGFEPALETVADILAGSPEFVSAQILVTLYSYAGNTEKFLYWLEKTYIRRNPDLPYLGVIPVIQRYKDEPRYIEIMQRMKLPLGEFE